jgi:uroporphyrinogen decarboxylase
MMRQAGRSLPEYREIRSRVGFHQMITTPELAAEVTLQPIRRHGMDAAVFFSDIITPVQAVVPGISVETGKGPVITQPFRTSDDLHRLRPLDADNDVPFVAEAIERCCAELDLIGVPVIGFAGAPFTVATYLIEGGKSKEFAHTKSMMYGQPELFFRLLDRLADYAIESLRAQVAAGASAVQLFDSWAGILSDADYRQYVLPHSAKIFSALTALGIPKIHFGVGTGELLRAMGDAGPDVVGVDWRVSLTDARKRVAPQLGLQGNLDPVILLSPWPVIEERVKALVAEGRATGPGWICNLGHGVLPEIDPTVITKVVELVHSL